MILGIDASRAFNAERTGVEEYAFRLLEAMKATTPTSVRVRLYIPKDYGLWIRDFGLPQGWEFRTLKGPTRLWTHTALAWELWCNPPDVFFQPSHVLPLPVTSYQLRVTRFVITIHDVGFARIPWAYSRFDRWYQHLTTKFAIRNSRSAIQIIVPSEFTKRELVELYRVNPDRIMVVPHATTYDAPTSYKLRATSSLDPCGFPYILSIGRIEKKKNTLGMIKWFEGRSMKEEGRSAGDDVQVIPSNFKLHTSNLHYMLIGPDGYGADEVYAYLASRPELQSRVHILGYVPEQKKWQLLAGARSLLHLSHYEGFGLPIAEAQVLGVPVMTSYQPPATSYESNRTWHDVARNTWQALLA